MATDVPATALPCVRDVRHIALLGGSSVRHVGDDAILEATIQGLRLAAPLAELIVLSPEPERTRRVHAIPAESGPQLLLRRQPEWVARVPGLRSCLTWAVYWLRALRLLWNAGRFRAGRPLYGLDAEERTLLRTLQRADVLLIVGGGNLTSRYRPGGLYARGLACVLAHRLGTPVVLSGQGVGPLDSAFDRRFTAWSLQHAMAIGVRDHGSSASQLRQIGVPAARLHERIDDAFATPAAEQAAVEACLASAGLPRERPLVSVAVQGLPGLATARRVLPALLDDLIDETDAAVALLPMMITAPDDDRRPLARLRASMRHREAARMLSATLPHAILVGVVARSTLAIAGRYHLAVFALAHAVPCLALAGDAYSALRMRGLFRHVGLDRFVVDARDPVALRQQLSRLRNEAPAVRRELQAQLPRLRAMSALYLEAISFAADVQDTAVLHGCFDAEIMAVRAPRRIDAGRMAESSVTVRNTGVRPWLQAPVASGTTVTVGCHWRGPSGEMVAWDCPRTLVPYAVYPGEQVTLTIPLVAPARRGRFQLQWDVCLEGVVWLSGLGRATPQTPIRVR